MKRSAILAVIACLCGCAVPGTGRAGFAGQSVQVTEREPALGIVVADLGTMTIAAGETAFSDNLGDLITVFDTRIPIRFSVGFGASTFGGFVISEVGRSPDTITGVSLGTTNLSGFDTSRLTFDSTDVFVNLRGINPVNTATLTVDVTFGRTTTAVPEPASLILAGVVAAALAGYGLRRRQRAAA
jgi:hypothetical protein